MMKEKKSFRRERIQKREEEIAEIVILDQKEKIEIVAILN